MLGVSGKRRGNPRTFRPWWAPRSLDAATQGQDLTGRCKVGCISSGGGALFFAGNLVHSQLALSEVCPEDVHSTSCLINLDPVGDSGTPSTIEELTCLVGPPHLTG